MFLNPNTRRSARESRSRRWRTEGAAIGRAVHILGLRRKSLTGFAGSKRPHVGIAAYNASRAFWTRASAMLVSGLGLVQLVSSRWLDRPDWYAISSDNESGQLLNWWNPHKHRSTGERQESCARCTGEDSLRDAEQAGRVTGHGAEIRYAS